MQTLREQGLGTKAIISSYPDKGWKLRKKVGSQVDRTGSAVLCLPATAYACAVWYIIMCGYELPKFNAKRLNRSENIPKSFLGGGATFLKRPEYNLIKPPLATARAT